MSEPHEHDWQHVRYGVHAQIGKILEVHHLRCECGERGFRRLNGSKVVYTWTKDESQWVTA